ncbi:MAG: YaaA family protein [Candidatus Izimaplasma sp.]|nr:YaaA family protein [Candidatus Izimaplasma bacterium]
MKFILAPSKTMELNQTPLLTPTTPLFIDQSNHLYTHLKSFSKAKIKTVMQIKNTLLDDTYESYQSYPYLNYGQALFTFTGMVYKHLDVLSLDQQSITYLNDHLIILDALYGALRPSDLIQPYRLDFKMAIGLNLYEYWDVSSLFKDTHIINLASKEFEKMLSNEQMITISFKEYKNKTYRTIGTYSKMARGKFLRYCATHNIQDVEALKSFQEDGYHYHHDLSNANHFVFTRTTK